MNIRLLIIALLLIAAGCSTDSSSTTPDDPPVADNEGAEALPPARPLLGDIDLLDSPFIPAEGIPATERPHAVTAVIYIGVEELMSPAAIELIAEIREEYDEYMRFVPKPIYRNEIGTNPHETQLLQAYLAADRQQALWTFAEHAAAESEAWMSARYTGTLEATRDTITQWVQELELDQEQFDHDYDDPALIRALLANTADANLNGHERRISLFLNGKKIDLSLMLALLERYHNQPHLSGERDVSIANNKADLEPIFDAAFAQAREYLEQGGAPERIYRELVERNLGQEADLGRLPDFDDDQTAIALSPADFDMIAGETEAPLVTIFELCIIDHGHCNSLLTESLIEKYGDEIQVVFWPQHQRYSGEDEPFFLTKAIFAATILGYHDEMRQAFDELIVRGQPRPTLELLAQSAGIELPALKEIVDSLSWRAPTRTPEFVDFQQWRGHTQETLEQFRSVHALVAYVGAPTLVINGIALSGKFDINGHTFVEQPPAAAVEEVVELQLELARHVAARTGTSGPELQKLLFELNSEEPHSPMPFQREVVVDPDHLDLKGLPYQGPKDAMPVVVFHNFTELSAASHRALKEAIEQHGEDVRLIWHPTTATTTGSPAALALAAQRQGLFWETYELATRYNFLFGMNRFASWVPDEVGLDETKLLEDLEDEDLHEQLHELNQNRSRAGVMSPSVLIGDDLIVGNPGVDGYREALQEAFATHQ